MLVKKKRLYIGIISAMLLGGLLYYARVYSVDRQLKSEFASLGFAQAKVVDTQLRPTSPVETGGNIFCIDVCPYIRQSYAYADKIEETIRSSLVAKGYSNFEPDPFDPSKLGFNARKNDLEVVLRVRQNKGYTEGTYVPFAIDITLRKIRQ